MLDFTDSAHSEQIIPMDLAGLRLDQALVRLFPEHSRSRLQGWISEGLVTLNELTVTPKHKVWGGELLRVQVQPDPGLQAYLPEDIPLDVVYADDSLLVINKPVGLVVHPGNGNWQGTLLNALLHYDPALAEIPRAGIVHRLDKDTSGLMVVARTLTAQTSLVRQLQARSVKREYLALAYGELRSSGTVDAPIGRHPTQRIKMAVVADGKPAVTHYQVLANYPGCTLLRCRLETGRTHQIRVHMAHLHHPLVGDATYLHGVPKCPPALRHLLQAFPRQALHATRLALLHPQHNVLQAWEVPPPPDMRELLTQVADFSE